MSKSVKKLIREGKVCKFKRILDDVKQSDVSSVVEFAVKEGTTEIVESIPNGWFHNQFTCPLLNIAVKRDHDAICRCLLGRGVDPNEEDESGHTALYEACLRQQINKVIVRLLLENNADPHQPTKCGQNTIKLLERKQRLDVIKLIEDHQTQLAHQVEDLRTDLSSVTSTVAQLSHALNDLATKKDIQEMAGNYVQLTRSISYDTAQGPARPSIRHYPALATQKEHVYSYLECDFLESHGSHKRSYSPEEQHHIKSKLTYIISKLQCNEQIKDIADRMYAKDALSDEQMQIIRETHIAKENARFIVINVILSGGKLYRFLAFVDALKDLKEGKMANVLMTRDQPPSETFLKTKL